MKPHRWSLRWPGNRCLDCGLDDPCADEDALVNCSCCGGSGRMPVVDLNVPTECSNCKGTGCDWNPDKVIPECTGGE
jgi:hypothetical protein